MKYTRFVLMLVLLVMGGRLAAQETAAEELPPAPDLGAQKLSAPTVPTVPGESAQAEDARDDQEERLAALETAMEQTNAAHQREMNELRAEISNIEDEMTMQEIEEAEQEGLGLRTYGFFDFTFAKNFYEENSLYNTLFNPYSSFVVSNLNLYFDHQLTRTLKSMVELRFTFLPNGQDLDYQAMLIFNEEGTSVVDTREYGQVYQRENTEVRDSFTTAKFRLGGVAIERVHLTWSPKDWFQVIAGYYLTPYGIWNVDHGSTVVLTSRLPYMQIREMVPLSQLGLQIFGRFFPRDHLSFDYAVTVSNGRGPTDTTADLDENKGVGLRLAAHLDYSDFKLSVGGYGYYGKYSDRIKTFWLYSWDEIDDEGNVVTSINEMERTMDIVEQYDEFIATADLKARYKGLLLQSEFVYRYVDHAQGGPITDDEAVSASTSPELELFHADFTGLGYYVLLGYELPVSQFLGGMKVTPYVMFEDNRSNDTQSYLNMKYYIAGLNLRPSPYVVIKVEWNRIDPENEFYAGVLDAAMAQMAVSF